VQEHAVPVRDIEQLLNEHADVVQPAGNETAQKTASGVQQFGDHAAVGMPEIDEPLQAAAPRVQGLGLGPLDEEPASNGFGLARAEEAKQKRAIRPSHGFDILAQGISHRILRPESNKLVDRIQGLDPAAPPGG
jgi:hypothetical protein